MNKPMIRAEDVHVYFPVKSGVFRRTSAYVKAVDGVSLEINGQETVGLVGETGCGKTTLGRCLLRLLKPSKGKVFFKGDDIGKFSHTKMRNTRQQIQMIFEHPALSLDPTMHVWEIIAEPLRVHHLANRKELRERVDEMLRLVELASYHAERFPNELSGGERQRVEIARALVTAPGFLVCDNALAQLDVSIQAQLLSLFIRLREEQQLAYLFIAHDLALVRQISDRIAVMYAGRIMETADCEEFFKHPLHPYSKALLSAVMTPDPKAERERKILLLPGELPNPISLPGGCRFHTRCQQAQRSSCLEESPKLREITSGHFVACHLC